MSKYVQGNIFLLLSILSASASQVVLKKIFSGMPAGTSTPEAIRLLVFTERVWRAGLAGLLVVLGYVFWVISLQKLPLSYAYPLACSSALFVAFFCVLFLGESVSWKLWLGTALIAIGSSLVLARQ